jgi:hypothetical protein
MGPARHVSACGCGSAGGAWPPAAQPGQLERIGDAHSAADRDARDRWADGGCAGGLSSGRRRSSGGCLPEAISSRPGPDPRIRLAGRARKHRCADPLLPASQATGLLPCCLCTNMWITCAQRPRACAYAVEMLGIPLPGRNHDRGLYLGERESHPVHAEKTGIIHMPRRKR